MVDLIIWASDLANARLATLRIKKLHKKLAVLNEREMMNFQKAS